MPVQFLRILFAGLLIVGLTGCGGDGNSLEGDVTSDGGFNVDFKIISKDGTIQFVPAKTTVHGSNGVVTVTNTLDADHGFIIRAFDITETIAAGETRSYRVQRAEPGEYQVDCHLHPAHEEATLTVD